ncbi:LytR/AlgR family response regulator transcription factor [Thomasclavelia spiroformis]|uniref:LytR/AlgR family response regulator transcription factor n=1 Tax=Thomasclavelia spiroformis TaxID=29348 RepID=UPI0039A07A35
MLKIGICDDDQLIKKQLGNIISDYLCNRNYSYELFFYSTGNDLLGACKDINFSFIFLDIDLGKENGVEIAKTIRAIQNRPINIVFVTSYPEYQTKVLSIHTFDYVIKPINNSQIYRVLDDLIFWQNIDMNREVERVRFKTIQGLITLYIDEILYFEYKNRRIDIITVDNIHHMYDKVKNIATLMKKYDFISPHAAYVINMKEIKQYLNSQNIIIMSNGDRIPISQLKAKMFKNEYMSYINKMWEKAHD